MPFSAQLTRIQDRHQTKIATFTCDAGDAANTVTYTWAGAGMGNHTRQPTEVKLQKVTGPDSVSDFQIEAMTVAGFTIRKITAGGAGAMLVRVKAR